MRTVKIIYKSFVVGFTRSVGLQVNSTFSMVHKGDEFRYITEG